MAEEATQGQEKTLNVIDKGIGGQIHVRLSEFKGRHYLDIRNFYETDDGEWKPTRKGISIPVEFFVEVLDALNEAKPEVEKLAAEE